MTDNIAIVTGGSRGIGRAAALKLGAAGYTVVVNYTANAAAADAVVKSITAAGGKAVAIKGDVSKEADILALFAAADKLGPLRVLVNNAGVMDQQNRLDEMTDGAHPPHPRHQPLRLHHLRARSREAHVDEAWRQGRLDRQHVVGRRLSWRTGLGVEYGASKGAIDVLTIGLGREVAAEGVRVNAIRPGIIDTEIHDSSGIKGRVKLMRDAIPMKREGTADEVADAILWLCSDQSSYVTGSIIPVAGGRC